MVWGVAKSFLCSIGKICGNCVEAGVISRGLFVEEWDVEVGLIYLNCYMGAYSVRSAEASQNPKSLSLRDNQLLMYVLFGNF